MKGNKTHVTVNWYTASRIYNNTLSHVPDTVLGFSSSPPRPERLCGPHILLFSGFRRVFPRGRGWGWLGHEADHVLPFCAEVKKAWIYTSTSPMRFIGMALIEEMDTGVGQQVQQLGYGLDDTGVDSRKRQERNSFFLSPCPDRLWGPPSLSNGYQGLSPREKAAGVWSWPLTSI